MPSVPAPRTWTAGEVVTAAFMNNAVTAVLSYLLAPPTFEGRQTVFQSLTTAVFADITYDVEDVDSAGGHSTVSNTARYTAQYQGWYFCDGGVGYAVNATGIRSQKWAVNGSAINGSQISLPATGATSAQYPARGKHIFLNVNDFVTLQGFQNSGGALNTDVTTTDQSNLTIRWVSN